MDFKDFIPYLALTSAALLVLVGIIVTAMKNESNLKTQKEEAAKQQTQLAESERQRKAQTAEIAKQM